MASEIKSLTPFLILIACTSLINVTSQEETPVDEPTTQKQKDGRFITFDSNGGEVKVELDFTIPFLRIPTGKSKTNLIEPSLILNTQTLVTAGTLLALLVTVVPKLVQLVVPQAQATQNLLPLMGKVGDTLRAMDIPVDNCYQKSACWVASNSFFEIPSPSSKRGAQWFEGLVESKAVREAFQRGLSSGDCSAYHCPVSMNVITQMLKLGSSLVKTDT